MKIIKRRYSSLVRSRVLFIALSLISFSVCTAANLPIGQLDNANQTGGSGWAYDLDAGTLPIDVHIYIDGRFYAVITANQSRPDLVTAGVTPNAEHGFSFTITGYDPTRAHEVIVYAINYGGGDNPILTNCPTTIGTQPSGNATISNVAGPSNIVITTTQRLAGAIHSLTWNGKEFIDSYDHGRQLQSATSFNGYGECFNPTEAGSAQDGTGSTSTSFLQYLNASGNYLETQCLPAFWTQPGYTAPGCGSAVNTTQRASHYFHKKVTIGMPNMAHVIKYDVDIDIPTGEICTSGTFEALTGYMPAEFSVFWMYDPASQQLIALSDGPGEQSVPIIFSTTDNNYAMGIYSPDLPQAQWVGAGYGRFRFASENCTKWNCVFRESTPPGTYNYQCYVIVGSLANVKASMTQLYNYLSPVSVGGTATASPSTICNGSAGTINVSGYTGSIQWQNSLDGSSWNNISGANAASYTTPALSNTTHYRAVVTNGSSQPDNSTTATITVYAPLTANTITGYSSSVCYNAPVTFQSNPSGGDGTNTINWFDGAGNFAGSGNSFSWNATSSGCGYYTVANSCGTATSTTACLTVYPLLTAGAITGYSSPLCYDTPVTLQSNSSGGNGTSTINWFDGAGNFVSSGTTLSFNITSLINGYYTVTNSCGSATSPNINIVVTPASVGGTATANPASVCSGNSGNISVAGYTGDIQWQNSSDGSIWADIAGANTAFYTTPVLLTTTYYSVVVTNAGCSSDNSTVATVTVSPASVGGITTANPTSVCSGNSSNISAVGYTGNIQWQSSSDGSTWADIAGANTAFYTTPVLSTTTYYRVIVTNAGCTPDNSTSAAVIVNPIPQIPVIFQNGDTLYSSAVIGNQWYYNDVAIPNAISNYFEPTNNGNYFVIASNAGCSSDTSNSIAFTLININNPLNGYHAYKIYPNPATTNIFIECDDEINQQIFSVYNSYNQLIYTGTFCKKTLLNLASYSKGIYILNIRNSKKSFTQRIVKL